MFITLAYNTLTTELHRNARYAETHPRQPLKGHQKPRAAAVSYRASVPAGPAGCGLALSYQASSLYGETLSFEIKGSPSALPQSIPNSEFLIPNWTYTFSAKERDSETGLSYFGSSYYSSDLSIWLSVDPQSDKYASLSPYVYCADNPVKLVDPDGEEIGDIYNLLGVQIGWDGKFDGKVYLYNTLSSEQLSITEAALLTSSPRADVVNVTEKYGLYNYELNLRATLSMLKQAEAGSSNDPLSYNSWNTGAVFTSHSYSSYPKDYQKHPGMNPHSKSSAAGAYQFLSRFYSMSDFSPTNQDKAALKLMTTKGYNAAMLGDIPSFVKECQGRWTSLKEWNIGELQSTFNAYRAMELHGISTIETPVGRLCR